jgi:aminobenzoyl-glutamate utilization protein B
MIGQGRGGRGTAAVAAFLAAALSMPGMPGAQAAAPEKGQVGAKLPAAASSVPVAPMTEAKKAALASIDRHRDEIVDLSLKVWRFAETALKETKSAAALADYAESQGFRVTRGIAGMPTAFVAEFGSGAPRIGIMGEYDALPGISQKASSTKEALEPGAPGHGCGHNLFGAASLGAALSIKEAIAAGRLKGTIRFYGTPAEEAIGGKVYMAREGLFRDLDVALAWHPSTKNEADTSSSQAMVDLKVEFFGKAAHAAYDPWNGRSAVDGLEIFTHALNMMREHVKPTVRMHYVIQEGGQVPNVIPEKAALWLWLRDSKRAGVEEVLARVRPMVQGSGMAAGVESKLTIQGGSWEVLVNMHGARLLYSNLKALPPLSFTPEEQEFARTIQKTTGVETKGLRTDVVPLPDKPAPQPEGGSTDVGDVSWVVPVIHLEAATAPDGAPWHAWPVVACGGMSIGQKGMIYASRALAMTMVDLFERPADRQAIRDEFQEQTKGVVYKGYVPDGPPPVPDTAGAKP